MIAALFVESAGCYFGIDGVDPWDIDRDARLYAGPHPVVAHPPCQRWGRFWHGSPSRPHQFALGDDGGCFASALASVRQWGGVIEHPADSRAWATFGIPRPTRYDWWKRCGANEWTCYVEQGHYGHVARKGTWLFFCGAAAPFALCWDKTPQRIDPELVKRRGYEVARRRGMISALSSKDPRRDATPVAFRDVLLRLAEHSRGQL
jgi:hypothetical protein